LVQAAKFRKLASPLKREKQMRLVAVVACIGIAFGPALGATPVPRQAAQPATGAQSANSAAPAPVKHKKKHHTSHQPSQKAPTADRITEIQSVLARDGYYQGNPTGKWDTNTVAAMQKFQSDNGIEANGKLDAPTLQKLGLGSDIAGVSAPKPVTSPACCSETPSSPPSPQTSAPAASSVASSADNATSQR
jgi:peptidoglycan hydrolase-like protein with peptidoglycan-binding domain